MKALTKISIGFLALAAAALWFTSCSSEDVTSGTNQGKMSSLTLTINTGKSMGSRATDWTTVGPDGSDENQINRITVGIFSSDGNTLRTIVELASGTGTDNTFKPETNGASTTIVTNSLADGDLIKVAVNAPKGHFVGIKKASDFQAKSEDASVALLTKADDSKETTKEACNNNVPMYGEGTLTPKNTGDNSVFKVSGDKVTVKHMLAKVSLESLKVDFQAGSAYANAEFTPVAAFLINVPDKMNFTTDVWKSDAALLHGWSAYAASDPTNCTFDYAAAAGNTGGTGTYAQYLTTENLTATALSGTASSGTATSTAKAWFYTLPNDKKDDGAAVTKNTKLVIAGKFIENKSVTSPTAEMVYYSLPINATYDASSHKYVKPANGDGSAFQVCPNQNYKCSVVIRTKGSKNPNTNLTPQEAEIKVEVKDFVDVQQNAEFN